jgi:hypothetical protein
MSIGQSVPGGSTYVLGHDEVELQRLLLQARLYDDDTEHALRRAGLRAGMRGTLLRLDDLVMPDQRLVIFGDVDIEF